MGRVNIDGELLRGQGHTIREMTNGCICCTIGGTLGLAIQDVAALKPDVIFIEATGLADPVELMDQATKEEVLPLVRLASLIAVLDPINFSRLAEEVHSGIRQQTELADVVVLNKRDLADEAVLAELEAQIRQLNPRTAIVRTERGGNGLRRDCRPTKQTKIPGTFPPRGRHRCTTNFHTLTCLCEAPLIRERFERLMRSLPDVSVARQGVCAV